MIWIIRLFLMAYAVLYFGIGAWAMIDPVKDALELSYEIPSFMDAVGLKVSGVIGYSEVAGLYGGINMIVGLLCLLGLFSRGIATYALSLLAFLTFSIALGRYLFALIPSTPTFYNTFFIFVNKLNWIFNCNNICLSCLINLIYNRCKGGRFT